MSRDYQSEEWIPWYVRDTPGWLDLSLAARGAAEGIARNIGRNRKGELPLGSRGLRGLSVLLRSQWSELEPALNELLAVGPNGEKPRLIYDAERNVLIDPDHPNRLRAPSTERVRRHREKIKSQSDADETNETRETDVTGGTICSSLLSSSLTSSERESAEREGSPPEPPPWWAKACDTVEMQTGEKLDRGGAWLRYWGHRATNGKRIAQPDAVYWLTTVDAKEARKERRDDAARRARAGPAPVSEPHKLTAEERKREAEMAIALMRGDKKPPRSGTHG